MCCQRRLRPVLGARTTWKSRRYRTQLLHKRGELLGGTAAKPLQWTMENNSGRQGDMADQASGNNEVHIQLKLKQTDAKILQAIEEALQRIEEGTYGALPRLRRTDCRCAARRHPVDARLHHLQGKTEGLMSSDLQTLLTEFAARARGPHRAPRSQRPRRRATTTSTTPISTSINREETHLSWLQTALAELLRVLPPAGASRCSAPAAPKTTKKCRGERVPRHPRR